MQGGCAQSCHDDLSISLHSKAFDVTGEPYDVTLSAGDHQAVYHCLSQQSVGDAESLALGECIPVGSAPAINRCYCGSAEFDLMTETDAEAQSLVNALGGSLEFTLTVTANGRTVDSEPSESVGTQTCEG